MKFSCNLFLRMMKNIEIKKLQRLVSVRKSEVEFKVQMDLCRISSPKVLLSSLYIIVDKGYAGAGRK